MTKIDTDFVRQKWQYKPEFGTADTSSLNNLNVLTWQYKPEFSTADTSSLNNLSASSYITSSVTTTASSNVIADEIQKKLDRMMYKEREMANMTYKGEPVVNISPGEREAHVRFMDNLVSIIRPKAMGITHESLTDGVTIEIQCDAVQTCKLYDTYDVRFYNQRPADFELDLVRNGFTNPKIKKDGKWYDLAPKKVIFSGPATTILWKDGTKTTVKCQDEDVWDDDVGIAMCYLKKMLGNKGNYNNIFREAMKVAVVQTKKEELMINKEAKKILEKTTHFDSAYDAVPKDYNFVEGNYEGVQK